MSQTDPSTLTNEERRQLAVNLRKQGNDYQTIGNALGITRQAAHKMVKRALDRIRATTEEDAQTIIDLEAQRLDDIMVTMMVEATKAEPDYFAVDRVLKIMERRAKLLGLDKPDKIAPTDPTGSEPMPAVAGYERALAELRALRRDIERSGETEPPRQTG